MRRRHDWDLCLVELGRVSIDVEGCKEEICKLVKLLDEAFESDAPDLDGLYMAIRTIVFKLAGYVLPKRFSYIDIGDTWVTVVAQNYMFSLENIPNDCNKEIVLTPRLYVYRIVPCKKE